MESNIQHFFSSFPPRELETTDPFSILKNSSGDPIHDNKTVTSRRVAKEGLMLTSGTSSQDDIPIQILTPKEQSRLNERGNKHLDRPLKLTHQKETKTTTLVNLNSAVKRLKGGDLTPKEVIDSLDDATLLNKMREKLLQEDEKLRFSQEEELNRKQVVTSRPLIVPTAHCIEIAHEISQKADDLEKLESKWKKAYPGEDLEEQLKIVPNQGITELTKIEQGRCELENLKSIHREKEKEREFLEEIRAHPQQMNHDPFIAMRVHQILHNLARHAILAGRIEEAFEIEANIAEVMAFSSDHPLYEMDEAILIGSAKQFDARSGAYFSGFGSSILKSGHLHASHRVIDGEKYNSFDFKINHYARDDLTRYVESIKGNQDIFQASLPEDLRKDFKMTKNCQQKFHRFDEETQQFTLNQSYCPALSRGTELSFGANGKVVIGNTPEVGCMYNKIMVQIPADCPPGEGLHRLHQILAVSGLGLVLAKQPLDNDERMKTKQLLRAFYPPLGTELEKTETFYSDSIDVLKKKIVEKQPEMTEIFRKYLETSPELMQKIEIAPGKEVWGVTDLGEQMRAKGAWGLMTGIGASGVWENTKVSIERMLTEGALSSEQRFQKGVFKEGGSSDSDLSSGGGDQVFTRLLSEALKEAPMIDFPVIGQAQILWDLDSVVARVPYGFSSDEYGVKNPSDSDYPVYKNRSNLISLSELNQSVENEVMVKNAIDPSHIVGIVVEKQEYKEDLAIDLLKKGLALQDESGAVYIKVKGKEILLDEFIHVGNPDQPFQRSWWQKEGMTS
ncbi:MAG: hypothetical protein ACH350_06270 [Parachlamydiaceae bacterium]